MQSITYEINMVDYENSNIYPKEYGFENIKYLLLANRYNVRGLFESF